MPTAGVAPDVSGSGIDEVRVRVRDRDAPRCVDLALEQLARHRGGLTVCVRRSTNRVGRPKASSRIQAQAVLV